VQASYGLWIRDSNIFSSSEIRRYLVRTIAAWEASASVERIEIESNSITDVTQWVEKTYAPPFRYITSSSPYEASLIQLIATAIDDKSPYTGGHCRRVPELTSLIAEAAHNSQSDYLKNFQLSKADRYQLNVAGWLHDCGKLTTRLNCFSLL
jgi:HD-GYP domain-containing protein (c-di-GMP phosphodiesterase class II)